MLAFVPTMFNGFVKQAGGTTKPAPSTSRSFAAQAAPAPVAAPRGPYADRLWQGQTQLVALRAAVDGLTKELDRRAQAGQVIPDKLRALQAELAKTAGQAQAKLKVFQDAVARGDYRAADAAWAEFTALIQKGRQLQAEAARQLSSMSTQVATTAGTTLTVEVPPDLAKAPGGEQPPPVTDIPLRPPPASPYR